MINLLAPSFHCAMRKPRRTPLLVCLLFAVSICAALEPQRAGASSTVSGKTRHGARRKVGRKAVARPKRSRAEFTLAPRRASEFEEEREGRASWFIYKRAYPFDSIPVEARRRAWEIGR